jgi:predicted anti-sigma-YlaC factor YlaD
MEQRMNCEEYQKQVSKLLDNALEKERMADVFNHLGICERCREFFESTMHLRQAMRSAAPLAMSATMDADVLQLAMTQSCQAPDRGPAQRLGRHHSLRSRISTFALLLMVTFFIGLLFSIKIDMPGQAEPIPQELVQPR